jgi:hypothetical protein
MSAASSRLLYVAVGLACVYGVWNPSLSLTHSTAIAILVVAIFMQPLTGYAIGRYWALVLPYAIALLAVPAGYEAAAADEREPLPIWWVAGIAAHGAALLMVPAIVVKRIREGRND